nr:PREDICTED: lipocalin-15-like isoform X1 [Struthio camelus australis]
MKTVLSSLALALLCLPWTQAEAPVQPGFDSEKFAGTWHIMAAVSNCPVFLSMKDKMKSSIIVTNFTPEGNLAMKVIFPMSDECKKLELFFQQSGQAGHYIDTAAEEKRDLRVMETDYDHYAIVYTVKESDREPSTTLQLYSEFGSGDRCLSSPRPKQDVATSEWQRQGSPLPSTATTSALNFLAPRHMQEIHFGMNETLHQKYPPVILFRIKSPPAVFQSGCKPP